MLKDCFLSIDELPIWNWWRVSETGNFIYLRKDADYKKKDYSLSSLWESLNDEYFDAYGISDNTIKAMKLKQKWILKRADFILNNNRFALTECDIIEMDLDDLQNDSKSMSNEESIIYLEERLGREVDPKRTSVKKYYDYINYYSK